MVTAAPNATYPVITGTATTAPASREISRKPSLATSFAFMGASVHRPGARVPYHEGQSPGNVGPLRAGVVAPATSVSPIKRRHETVRGLAGGVRGRSPPASDGRSGRRTRGAKQAETGAAQVRRRSA